MIHVRGERGDNPRCWLWLCLSADAVRMHIDPTRSARAARVLFAKLGETLQAILVCDRYGAYRKLARELAGRFVLATCWVYVAVVIMLRRAGIVAPDMRIPIFSAT